MIKARITVTLKTGVLDPQGKAIEHALTAMDFRWCRFGASGQGIRHRTRRRSDRAKAEADLKAMCDKLLANTVIENYAVEIV